MIKNNIKKWLFIATITPLFIISCTKEWLDDVTLDGASTEEVYYSSIGGISQLVVGTYAELNIVAPGLHNLDIMYMAFGTIASDEAEAGGEQGGNDIVDFQNWDKGDPAPSESRNISLFNWAYNYKVIAKANTALAGIKFYREKNGSMPADTAALLNRFEGEMEFLRAFSHFKLTQIYGGVPIIDHNLASSEFNQARRTVAECLHFVQERLEIAVSLLPEKSAYPASEAGRATKGAAEALLAKAFLYESSYAENYSADVHQRFVGCTNQYALALTHAENVINSGQYSLLGIDGTTFDSFWSQDGSPMYPAGTPGYRFVFSPEGNNSDESIFSTQAINDGGPYMLSRGSYITIYSTVRNYITSAGSATALGWGFFCPTDDLLNAYDTADPRLKVTIGRNDDPIKVTDTWGRMNTMQSPTNMIGRKYEGGPLYWGPRSTDGNGPNSFHYIRYADVVLMAAEAAVKTGDAGKALNYVNMVRTRARNGATTGVPANLSAVTIDDIIKERQLELALEGHRFFDLVRWKKTDVMIDQPLQKWLGGNPQPPAATCSFTTDLNEFFPLPLTDVINSNFTLVQYPGYE